MRKHNQPGCKCCFVCGQTCWNCSLSCGGNAAGAIITVENASGSTLLSVTADSSGHACADLSAYYGQSLNYSVSYPGPGVYSSLSGVSMPSFCGATYSSVLQPPATLACCSACAPYAIPSSLHMHDPYAGIVNFGALSGPGSCTSICGSCVYQNDLTLTGANSGSAWYWGTTSSSYNPHSTNDNWSMVCSGSTVTLNYQNWFQMAYYGGGGSYACPTGLATSHAGTVTASSVSCSPFVATFAIPSFSFNCSNSSGVCATITIPAHTITIYE
jgi:hypothetical protein